MEELVTNCKIKNARDLYRGISDFRNGYQPRTTFLEWSGIQTDFCLLMTSTFFVK